MWSVDRNVTFVSEIVDKGNLSKGYFYENNGITKLGIEVIFHRYINVLTP